MRRADPAGTTRSARSLRSGRDLRHEMFSGNGLPQFWDTRFRAYVDHWLPSKRANWDCLKSWYTEFRNCSTLDTERPAWPTLLARRSLSCQEGRKTPHMEHQNDLYEYPINIHRFATQNVKIATRITSFCKALHIGMEIQVPVTLIKDPFAGKCRRNHRNPYAIRNNVSQANGSIRILGRFSYKFISRYLDDHRTD